AEPIGEVAGAAHWGQFALPPAARSTRSGPRACRETHAARHDGTKHGGVGRRPPYMGHSQLWTLLLPPPNRHPASVTLRYAPGRTCGATIFALSCYVSSQLVRLPETPALPRGAMNDPGRLGQPSLPQ